MFLWGMESQPRRILERQERAGWGGHFWQRGRQGCAARKVRDHLADDGELVSLIITSGAFGNR
jgi:hypothetical protein